jgi:hypothetical protein
MPEEPDQKARKVIDSLLPAAEFVVQDRGAASITRESRYRCLQTAADARAK